MSAAWESIPAELRERDQWVIWRRETRDGKSTKVPYQASTPARKASSTNAATWAPFDQAVGAAARADGIGYVFASDDPYVGVDLDERTTATDALVQLLNSYTEKSVSGAGLHVIVKGNLNGWDRNRRGKVEVYDRGRYFCMTGKHVAGCPQTIEERQDALAEVLRIVFPAAPKAEPAKPSQPTAIGDHELIEKMLGSRSGHKIAPLWAGDCSGYASQSEADQALCNHLAFWTGRDPDCIDRLFRLSGLYREKWERGDYRERTINGAIGNTTETYSPAKLLVRPLESTSETPRLDRTADPDDEEPAASPYLDWSTFWQQDFTQADFVYPELLARGRLTSIWAGHKVGKSQIMLFLAATMATGGDRLIVVYLDYEMTADDVYDRLEDMGYGSGSDLSRLRYALFPPIPPLDTAAGGAAVLGLVQAAQSDYPDHHVVLFVDTINRAVQGNENDADTWNNVSRHTGIPVKRAGATFVRSDQSGKDEARGARGSSGKGDDVDVEWHLTRTDSGVSLKRTLSRLSWIPEKVLLSMNHDPLRYTRTGYAYPAGTEEAAAMLDRLKVPLDTSHRKAKHIVREGGEHCRNDVLLAALNWRRQRSGATS